MFEMTDSPHDLPRMTPSHVSESDDMTPHAAESADPPTTSTRVVRAAILAAERSGCSRTAVLDRTDLSDAELLDVDHRITHDQEEALWSALLAASKDPLIGVRAAGGLWRGAFGIVEYAARSAANVGDALQILHRYSEALHGRPVFTVDASSAPVRIVYHAPHPDSGATGRTAAEFTMASLVRILLDATQGGWRPQQVHIRQGGESAAALGQMVGCEVLHGQADHAILFDHGRLQTPMRDADAELNVLLVRQLETALKTLPDSDDVVERTRRIIEQLIGREPVKLQTLARRLGYAPRTLQLRLREADWSFRSLRDDVRIGVAKAQLLSGRHIKRIAADLGYADTRAFYRAFKRVAKTTPNTFRHAKTEPRELMPS